MCVVQSAVVASSSCTHVVNFHTFSPIHLFGWTHCCTQNATSLKLGKKWKKDAWPRHCSKQLPGRSTSQGKSVWVNPHVPAALWTEEILMLCSHHSSDIHQIFRNSIYIYISICYRCTARPGCVSAKLWGKAVQLVPLMPWHGEASAIGSLWPLPLWWNLSSQSVIVKYWITFIPSYAHAIWL